MPPTSPAPSLPAAALFDWDGTIVDTLPLIYRANVVVLGELGIPLSREWFLERYTPDWRASYRELGVPEDRWEAVAARWAEEMRAGRPRALPWARGALRRLARHGVRLGLVTASTRNVVEPSLRRLNLEGVFETAYFSDDVVNGKPHPEALLRALADLGVAPADAVYLGDTIIDQAMAAAAGTPFRAAGVERVWPGVGAWADDLLGRATARPA
jgi:HAD superfamily hydrolase (TIGR01509 family)